jgi:hypothetical protein
MYRQRRKLLYACVYLGSICGMPRRPTVQPSPLETFTLDDGTLVEVRDHATREIGRGLDKKFLAEETDWQVLHGLVDDLESGDPARITRAGDALASNHAMERYLYAGEYGMNERTGRRHGKSIRKKYQTLMRIVHAVHGSSPQVHPLPCPAE